MREDIQDISFFKFSDRSLVEYVHDQNVFEEEDRELRVN